MYPARLWACTPWWTPLGCAHDWLFPFRTPKQHGRHCICLSSSASTLWLLALFPSFSSHVFSVVSVISYYRDLVSDQLPNNTVFLPSASLYPEFFLSIILTGLVSKTSVFLFHLCCYLLVSGVGHQAWVLMSIRYTFCSLAVSQTTCFLFNNVPKQATASGPFWSRKKKNVFKREIPSRT